jgi:hypothetical protein
MPAERPTPKILVSKTTLASKSVLYVDDTDHVTTDVAGFRYDPNFQRLIVKGGIDVKGSKILKVGTPTLDDDAANKAYVDSAVSAWTGSLELTQVMEFGGDTTGLQAHSVNLYVLPAYYPSTCWTTIQQGRRASKTVTLKNLKVFLGSVHAGGSITFTIQVATAATGESFANTSLTCTLTAGSSSASDTTNTAVINAGERYALKAYVNTSNITSAGRRLYATVEATWNP